MNNKASEGKPGAGTAEEDLSDLLDSALADFSASAPAASSENEQGDDQEAPEELGAAGGPRLPPLPAMDDAEEWSKEFIRHAAQNFDPSILNLLDPTGTQNLELTDENIKLGLERMAVAAQSFMIAEGVEEGADFAASISQAVQSLAQGSNSNRVFDNLNAQPEASEYLPPFMHNMMHSLLSKEILYPSLKDVLDKFPVWLEQNDHRLNRYEKEKYAKQQELMQQVCDVVVQEKDADQEELKQKRFAEVLELMQRLQEYGQPPAELVGEIGGAQDIADCSLM